MSFITFYTTPFVPLTPPPAIRSLVFSSDGNQIVVGYENGYIEIYPTMFVYLEIYFLKKNKFNLD